MLFRRKSLKMEAFYIAYPGYYDKVRPYGIRDRERFWIPNAWAAILGELDNMKPRLLEMDLLGIHLYRWIAEIASIYARYNGSEEVRIALHARIITDILNDVWPRSADTTLSPHERDELNESIEACRRIAISDSI